MKDKFFPLSVSSKFSICGLPLRGDSYKSCVYGCKYCFANCRVIMPTKSEIECADIDSLRRKLERVKNGMVNDSNFLDMLLKERITWHWGSMSDPFQPINRELKLTERVGKMTRDFGYSVLFSTKTDFVDLGSFDRNLHSFQLSMTNMEDRKDIEPNVPPMKKRIELFEEMKIAGFRVGIRIQPFIPDISSLKIVKRFLDADHFSIEGLKLVPQNSRQIDQMLEITGIPRSAFKQMGLLNLSPEYRQRLYKPFIDLLEEKGCSYSIADNDMHYLSTSKCCCGDSLVTKSTDFNNTAMYYKNKSYGLSDVLSYLRCFENCKIKHLFSSNRQNGFETVKDFICNKWTGNGPTSKNCYADNSQKELF